MLKSETLPTYLLTRVKSRDASASKKTQCFLKLEKERRLIVRIFYLLKVQNVHTFINVGH